MSSIVSNYQFLFLAIAVSWPGLWINVFYVRDQKNFLSKFNQITKKYIGIVSIKYSTNISKVFNRL